MGCFQDRNMTKYWKMLNEVQKDLRFYDRKAVDFDISLKKWTKSYITQRQLEISLQELGSPIQRTNWFEMTKIRQFYLHFKKQEGYEVIPIIILGVVLCGDTNIAKAKLIFENLDEDCKDKISAERVKYFLTLLGNFASYLIEFSNSFEEYQGQAPSSVQIQKSVPDISQNQNSLQSLFLQLIMKNQEFISKEDFIQTLVGLEKGRLLNAFGILEICNKNA